MLSGYTMTEFFSSPLASIRVPCEALGCIIHKSRGDYTDLPVYSGGTEAESAGKTPSLGSIRAPASHEVPPHSVLPVSYVHLGAVL